MTTITIPNAVMIGIANLIHFTPALKSDRDMTPILATIQVTLVPISEQAGASTDRYQLTAIATDRYMVGRYVTELTAGFLGIDAAEAADQGISFLLSLELLKRVKPTTRDVDWTVHVDAPRPEHYTAQYTESTVTVSNGTRSVTEPVTGGNYPAVARLIPEEYVPLAEVYALNATHLARLSKIVDPTGDRYSDNPWRLEGTKTEHPTRPGPVVWHRSFANGHHYVVLQQPNLLR